MAKKQTAPMRANDKRLTLTKTERAVLKREGVSTGTADDLQSTETRLRDNGRHEAADRIGDARVKMETVPKESTPPKKRSTGNPGTGRAKSAASTVTDNLPSVVGDSTSIFWRWFGICSVAVLLSLILRASGSFAKAMGDVSGLFRAVTFPKALAPAPKMAKPGQSSTAPLIPFPDSHISGVPTASTTPAIRKGTFV